MGGHKEKAADAVLIDPPDLPGRKVHIGRIDNCHPFRFEFPYLEHIILRRIAAIQHLPVIQG